MLVKQLISNKTPKKSRSYYIIEQMNDDIDSNTDNTNDDQIRNMDNSLEFTKNTSYNNKNLQNNVLRNLLFKEILIHLKIVNRKGIILKYWKITELL